MVFSSWQFLFVFLPITFFIYFWLNHRRWVTAGKAWLVLTSLFFYGYWDVRYLPLILGSILGNYLIGTTLARVALAETAGAGASGLQGGRRRILLAGGITANLLLLGYYKYTDFFISNLNVLTGSAYALQHIALPLAISFFTFTQIVYLVDSYRGETARYDLLNYALFVTFFPHLIAGPIVHHGQIMPQFLAHRTLARRHANIVKGLFIFAMGLFKKVVIADSFAVWATEGFDGGQPLDFFAAWKTSLSYTFQLYFDFSGYCDMAIGASLLFNIWLPINFNSPYKALSIQDFWRRWHITLSHFLRDYLYIPLGGNRKGRWRTFANLFITFVLGGLWHGATWMFVIWGGLHGGALVVHRLWQGLRRPLPAPLAWLLTFLFVNFAWVFFRAQEMSDALRVLRGMVDIGSITGTRLQDMPTAALAWAGATAETLAQWMPASLVPHLPAYAALAVAFCLLACRNSLEWAQGTLGHWRVRYGAALMVIAVYWMLSSTSTVFLYFTF